MNTDRKLMSGLWNDGWNEGLWAASWSKSIEGLTAQDAAWSPAPGRHSIWQIVLHMCFWREEALRRLEGREKATAEVVNASNFPAVSTVNPEAWEAARVRLAQTQTAVLAAMRDGPNDPARLMYLITHDSYHIGQINYLRAMLGKSPIE